VPSCYYTLAGGAGEPQHAVNSADWAQQSRADLAAAGQPSWQGGKPHLRPQRGQMMSASCPTDEGQSAGKKGQSAGLQLQQQLALALLLLLAAPVQLYMCDDFESTRTAVVCLNAMLSNRAACDRLEACTKCTVCTVCHCTPAVPQQSLCCHHSVM
jgi:hypothetical protein